MWSGDNICTNIFIEELWKFSYYYRWEKFQATNSLLLLFSVTWYNLMYASFTLLKTK